VIRRDSADSWLLISQLEHARIAAEITAAWGGPSVPPLPVPEWLVPAIRRHDDGWTDWERAPTILPETGAPRDFTEMPMPVATRIWSRSIDVCAAPQSGGSPLGALSVSRHFCHLAEHARNHRSDAGDRSAAEQFLREQADRQCAWRETLSTQVSTSAAASLEEQGYRAVQFFDRLSLWLCCAARTVPAEIASGPFVIRLLPQDASIALAPWPLQQEDARLEVDAAVLPRQRFDNDTQLRAALAAAPRRRLTWVLRPPVYLCSVSRPPDPESL
jgi:hypothetical protein